MPSVQGNYAGDITRIYYVPTVLADRTESGIETAIADSDTVLIGDVTEVGEITAEATNIEFAIAGQEFSSSIPGQRSPGTYDFTVAVDWSDTGHNTLATLSPRTNHSWIVEFFESTANRTWVVFDGRLGNATIGGNVGEVGTLAMSIYRTGAHTIVHNT